MWSWVDPFENIFHNLVGLTQTNPVIKRMEITNELVLYNVCHYLNIQDILYMSETCSTIREMILGHFSWIFVPAKMFRRIQFTLQYGDKDSHGIDALKYTSLVPNIDSIGHVENKPNKGNVFIELAYIHLILNSKLYFESLKNVDFQDMFRSLKMLKRLYGNKTAATVQSVEYMNSLIHSKDSKIKVKLFHEYASKNLYDHPSSKYVKIHWEIKENQCCEFIVYFNNFAGVTYTYHMVAIACRIIDKSENKMEQNSSPPIMVCVFEKSDVHLKLIKLEKSYIVALIQKLNLEDTPLNDPFKFISSFIFSLDIFLPIDPSTIDDDDDDPDFEISKWTKLFIKYNDIRILEDIELKVEQFLGQNFFSCTHWKEIMGQNSKSIDYACYIQHMMKCINKLQCYWKMKKHNAIIDELLKDYEEYHILKFSLKDIIASNMIQSMGGYKTIPLGYACKSYSVCSRSLFEINFPNETFNISTNIEYRMIGSGFEMMNKTLNYSYSSLLEAMKQYLLPKYSTFMQTQFEKEWKVVKEKISDVVDKKLIEQLIILLALSFVPTFDFTNYHSFSYDLISDSNYAIPSISLLD